MAVPIPTQYRLAGVLRADLRRARAGWIRATPDRLERRRRRESEFLEVETGAGRLDFHSLRHTFITNLARAGVHPAVAQELARHSDIRLTMEFYTHTSRLDHKQALELLPDVADRTDDQARRAG